jgi:hypothetical protein
MADFEYDVSRFVKRAGARMDEALRGIAEAAVARVKELTPVRTGFLRANWTAVIQGDAEPIAAPSGNPPRIEGAKAGDVITIVNPVKYARRMEYGFTSTTKDGETKIHPGRGMVQQTLLEMPKISERVLRNLR